MTKLLCLNRGMTFQGYLMCKALDNYFDEVHLYGPHQTNTTYEYPIDMGELRKYDIDEIEDFDSYDCVFGLEQGSLQEVVKLHFNNDKAKAIYGIHILDFPQHALVKGSKDFSQSAFGFWNVAVNALEYSDFIIHNQKISINMLAKYQKGKVVKWVLFPVNPIGEEISYCKDYILFAGRRSPDKGIYYVIAALSLIPKDIPFRVIGSGYDYTDFARHLKVNYEQTRNCSEEDKWRMLRECRFTICGADNFCIPTLCVLEGIAVNKSGIVFDTPENRRHYGPFVEYVKFRDINALAEAIVHMWARAGDLEKAKDGSKWVKENCTYDVWAKQIYETYIETKEKKCGK